MHHFIKTLLAAIGLAWCAAAHAEQPAPAPPPPTAAQLEQALQAFDVPGVAMAVLSNCAVDQLTVAGKADLQSGAAVQANTAFEAASLSKAVFAWLVMSLVEDGLIELDRPFAADFDYPRITDQVNYAKLTPRLVLTHRTGLPNWVDEDTPFHQRTAAIPFNSEPGSAFSYSGEGFQLLQAYVEEKSGQTLEQLFQARLGRLMPHSTFQQPLPDGVIASRGYRATSQPETGRDMINLKERGMAAGSFVTTAGDFAGFIGQVCAQEGLSKASYERMFEPQSPAPDEQAPFPTSWALGWMTADMGGPLFIGHGGNNDEYRALAGFVRPGGDGLVILTNGANGQALIDALIVPE